MENPNLYEQVQELG